MAIRKTCSVCGNELSCGQLQSGEKCWCSKLPAIMPLDSDQGCQCPACLAKTIGKRIEEVIKGKPLVESLALASAYRDNPELIENIDYTIEQGNMVFSAWYHLKRGECCGNGCRNCPYG